MMLNSRNNAFLCHYTPLFRLSQYNSGREGGLLTPMAPLDPPLLTMPLIEAVVNNYMAGNTA